MKKINALFVGFVVLLMMSPSVFAEETQSEPIEMLELVALGSVALATILSFMVAFRLGGEMGNALKIIAVSITCMGILREIFSILGDEGTSEIFEILGGLGLLVGFYMLYKSSK